MTDQEIFNKSWLGMKAQGFKRAVKHYAGGAVKCVYLTDEGLRCAWGHVDTNLTAQTGDVITLNHEGIGLAAELDYNQLDLAYRLQRAHDTADTPARVESAFRILAAQRKFTIPDEEIAQ